MKGILLNIILFNMMILACNISFSQKDINVDNQSYIIKKKGDTIYTKIEIRTFILNQKKVICYDNSTNKTTYNPKNLRAYYNGKDYYESIQMKGKNLLLLKKINGPVELYMYTYRTSGYGTNEEGVSLYHSSGTASTYVLQKENEELLITSIEPDQYIKEVKELLKDCYYIYKAHKHGYFACPGVEQLVSDYNNWVIGNSNKR